VLASIATFGIILGMALEGYKSNNNVVYSSKYHVVWTPKYRRCALLGPIAKRCKAGVSSRTLRQEFHPLESRLPTLRTNSYLVSTVGGAALVVIKQYGETGRTYKFRLYPNRTPGMLTEEVCRHSYNDALHALQERREASPCGRHIRCPAGRTASRG
jgi:putative transposase